MERLCEKRPLSANALKYIAVIAMVIDHIGWAWVPTASVLGQLMHLIGRFTAPIMCFFIAEGYYHTRDVNKYLTRLFVFALISHFPFAFAEGVQSKPIWTENGSIHFNEELFLSSTGVIFTLFLGLMALKIWQTEENKTKRYLRSLQYALFQLWATGCFLRYYGCSASVFITAILKNSFCFIIWLPVRSFFLLSLFREVRRCGIMYGRQGFSLLRCGFCFITVNVAEAANSINGSSIFSILRTWL